MRKHRQRWIRKAYRWICKYMGAPANDNEQRNMRQWAASLADDECGYIIDGYSPKEAVQQDIEYGL